jgi:hypothetical protein
VVLPEIRPELMADELFRLYSEPGRLQSLSGNALAVFRASHEMESRWSSVREFLQLPEER